MRLSLSALVLGTLAAGTVNAASISHQSLHGKRHNHAARHTEVMQRTADAVEVEKRDSAAVASTLLTTAGAARLSALSILTGLNQQTPQNPSIPWIGTSGNANFTNEFVNQSNEDLVLTLWGPAGSWVNAVKPQITVSIAKGQSQTVSFPNGWAGAWAPVYGSSTQVMGQIADTWGEASFSELYSTADVSREVNMVGRNMKIVTPNCYSDMSTCVFKCGTQTYNTYGIPQCLTGYKLENCAIGSQVGANFGKSPWDGGDSGGCSNMGTKAKLTTYLGFQ